MIDKNIQLVERDNEQDTGEEKSNVSAAEDPSRLVHAEVRQEWCATGCVCAGNTKDGNAAL